MKGKAWLAALGVAALVGVFVPGMAVHKARADTPQPPNVNLALVQAMLNGLPAPPDDPMLDANGNPVLDASGNRISDPNEQFHQVIPRAFDPFNTHLVESTWEDGLGCPTNAQTNDGTAAGTFTDPACPVGDPKDARNQGLLLVKTGPTTNFASATAELKKVRGQSVTDLGYDIRKPLAAVDPRGSHCGAGAPRFDVFTTDGIDHFIGCNSPTATLAGTSNSWIRLRWSAATAFPPISATETVSRILIVFDEGMDTGPDNFGAAILDNIDFNGQIVGRGPNEG